jgi:hypothetical protein
MRGRFLSISVPRRMIGDLMAFAAGVPSVPVQRRMWLGPVAAARSSAQVPWTAVFTKAMALLAAEFPEFRRAYCKFPWSHFYEYPVSVAHIAIEREYHGEPAVLGLRIKDPANRSIAEIGSVIREAASAPIEQIKSFRQALGFAKWPKPIRRLLWWVALNVGRIRPNYFGTFGISVYSSLGAESLHPISPLTVTLNYGVIAPNGSVDVRLIYDHRVLDGATVARALARLEQVLNTVIRKELEASGLAGESRVAA